MHTVYVDNASVDASVEIAQRANGVHIIEKAVNLGYGHACNTGAEHAIGLGADVLFFLNPDTRVDVETVMSCADFLAMHRAVGVAGPLQVEYGHVEPKRFNRWTRRAVRCAAAHPLDHHRYAPFADSEFARWRRARPADVNVSYVNGAGLAIRTDVVMRCGGFDPVYFMYFEDVDLCRKVRSRGYEVVLLPNLEMEHAWGGHDHGERRRLWTVSKYRYLLADPQVTYARALGLASRHLLRDVARGGGNGRAGFEEVTRSLRPGSLVRCSRRRSVGQR
jgi:GT2 family glycosyltransferase